ncbi:hypothetical protein FHG87_003422 [Trinorchestia longiramus]|nr:hypothetical protein FHG87_003422 [Trinorchestia longiramus]
MVLSVLIDIEVIFIARISGEVIGNFAYPPQPGTLAQHTRYSSYVRVISKSAPHHKNDQFCSFSKQVTSKKSTDIGSIRNQLQNEILTYILLLRYHP